MVGSFKLSSKKPRAKSDYPFSRLSNGALNKVKCGWMRSATTDICDEEGKFSLKMQATI